VGACWAAFYWQVFSGWRFVQRGQNDLGAKRSNRSSFVLGGALGLFAILIHSYFDFNMHIPANAILAVTVMAMVSSYYRFASERWWHTVRRPLRCAVFPVLVAALVFLGWQTWRRTGECAGLLRVQTVTRAIQRESGTASPERLADLGRQQVAALESVMVAEPQNLEAAKELGEALRIQSFTGLPGYESLAEKAMVWFKRAMKLNPYDAQARIGLGMCLDWLGRPADAAPLFKEAERLDPNHYSVPARVGWHYFQTQDYTRARDWFEKSRDLLWDERVNSNTFLYLKLTREKLAGATNQPAPPKP
jgi:hypothetical protein